MSTVYIIQNPQRWDGDKGQMVGRFDFSSSHLYGEPVFLLSPTAAPFNGGPIIRELEEKLDPFRPEDFLLMVGNPVIIAWSGIIAQRALAWNTGNPDAMPACLQWSGKDRQYIEVTGVDLTEAGGI